MSAATHAALRTERALAALRTLDTLSDWLLRGNTSLEAWKTRNGRVQVLVNGQVFTGEDLQDALAQVAQTILANGGSL